MRIDARQRSKQRRTNRLTSAASLLGVISLGTAFSLTSSPAIVIYLDKPATITTLTARGRPLPHSCARERCVVDDPPSDGILVVTLTSQGRERQVSCGYVSHLESTFLLAVDDSTCQDIPRPSLFCKPSLSLPTPP